METIKAEVPNLNINVWYLDDGTQFGNPADLALALKIIEGFGLSRDLHLNKFKSFLHILRSSTFSSNPLPSDFPIVRNCFVLLGCHIGPRTFCHSVLMRRVKNVKETLSRLFEL